MGNWLINLNWDWNIELWLNCRKRGRAAIGWDDHDDDGPQPGLQRALGYLRQMKPGDRIVAFLKERRLGGWGRVASEYDPLRREPQLYDTDYAGFSRCVAVEWQHEGCPTEGHAARMNPEDVHGFSTRSTINPLTDEAFERLKIILADQGRREPIAELEEEFPDEEEAAPKVGPATRPIGSPIREDVLRRLIAADLSILEPGLQPFDESRGAEEFPVGEAGRIDLFCRDTDGNPVVVELKQHASSDQVIGQLARYMGYVREHHLPHDKKVRGFVVCHHADAKLLYAVKALQETEVRRYEVQVTLRSLD